MSVFQSRPRPCCLPSDRNYKLLLSEMHPAPFTMLGIVARLAEMTVPQADQRSQQLWSTPASVALSTLHSAGPVLPF